MYVCVCVCVCVCGSVDTPDPHLTNTDSPMTCTMNTIYRSMVILTCVT